LIFLFTAEQLINGCRRGFDHPEPSAEPFSGTTSIRMNEDGP
jgi:hypothetical protein